MWAAAWLFRATGEAPYLSYVTSRGPSDATESSWDDKSAGVAVLMATMLPAGSTFAQTASRFVCRYLDDCRNLPQSQQQARAARSAHVIDTDLCQLTGHMQ